MLPLLHGPTEALPRRCRMVHGILNDASGEFFITQVGAEPGSSAGASSSSSAQQQQQPAGGSAQDKDSSAYHEWHHGFRVGAGRWQAPRGPGRPGGAAVGHRPPCWQGCSGQAPQAGPPSTTTSAANANANANARRSTTRRCRT